MDRVKIGAITFNQTTYLASSHSGECFFLLYQLRTSFPRYVCFRWRMIMMRGSIVLVSGRLSSRLTRKASECCDPEAIMLVSILILALFTFQVSFSMKQSQLTFNFRVLYFEERSNLVARMPSRVLVSRGLRREHCRRMASESAEDEIE